MWKDLHAAEKAKGGFQMKGTPQDFTLVFFKGKKLIDAWWFVGTIEQAISVGRRSLAGYECNSFRVEKYANPDIVYYFQEVK